MSEPTCIELLRAFKGMTLFAESDRGDGTTDSTEALCSVDDVLVVYDLANQRAGAAEAERDETVAGAEYRRKLLTALETRCAAAEAERDALRKDAARLDWVEEQVKASGAVWFLPWGDDMRFVQIRRFGDIDNRPTVKGDVRAALDAALAVQPTTEGRA